MRGTRPLPLQVHAHVSAEGRGRTDTRVAPQQFLRLSRLPIPPLRPAFRSVKVASDSWLFSRFFPRYFAKSLAPPAYSCLTAVLYHAFATAGRAIHQFTFCRHNSTLFAVIVSYDETKSSRRNFTWLPCVSWCRGPESNWGHADFQSAALPTELPRRLKAVAARASTVRNNRDIVVARIWSVKESGTCRLDSAELGERKPVTTQGTHIWTIADSSAAQTSK